MCGAAIGQSDSESGDLVLSVSRRFIGHHTLHALSHGLSGKTMYCLMYYCLLQFKGENVQLTYIHDFQLQMKAVAEK